MPELMNTIMADGPSSNPNQPVKQQMRAWGTWVETLINSIIAGGGKLYTAKVDMDGDLSPATNTTAIVLGDSVVGNDGLYVKNGASGSGAWIRVGDVPGYSFVLATNAGAGTANAIKATTSTPVGTTGGVLIALPVVAANTTTPVTVSFNDGPVLTIKTSSGSDVAVGGLQPSVYAGYITGSTFTLLSDQAGAAIVEAAEAAQAAAEAARDEAVGAVPSLILASIAALRNFTAASSAVMANVIGYISGSTVGGDDFWHDADDTTSADDGGTVIVDSIGRRWKRRFTSTRPEQWGAVGHREGIEDFKARLAAGTAREEYAELQAAIYYLASKGGGTLKLSRFHLCNTPLVVPYGVSIKGIGRDASGIFKDSTTTLAVTYYGVAAGSLVLAYPGALPTDVNAVILLGSSASPAGRWTGFIKDCTIGGTLSDPADAESWKVEFGILNVGNIAYASIKNTDVQTVQRGMVIPSNWIMGYENCHIDNCQSGLGIENGTSTTIEKIYANNCRDYGIALRYLLYSHVGTTAVDFLNDPTLYPDRTRECSAYIFQSLIGTTIQSAGQEQTWGNGMVLDSLRFCTIKSGVNIGIGSDYAGTADIAFIKVKNALIGCEVTGNMGFDVKPTGLISGSANAAKHHNLFAEGSVYFTGTTFHNNVVQAASSGLDAEAGWGNNNINECLAVKRGGIYTRADASDVYGNILQGTGNTASTNSLDVRNGDGTSQLRLRDDNALFAPPIYAQTTGAAANVFVGSDGSMFRSTSALKYKNVIGPIPDDMTEKVMAMVGFIYSQKGDETKRRLVGLAADHFHEAGLSEFVHYGADGEPEGLMYERIVAVIMEACRRQSAQLTMQDDAIKWLKARVTAIEARLT